MRSKTLAGKGRAMIIDAHYHLDERLETVSRLLDQMNRNHIDRIALIAALSDPFPSNVVIQSLVGIMRGALAGRLRRLGLRRYDRMVGPDGRAQVLNKAYLIYTQPDNRTVQRVMQQHPDKFLGWIVVNPKVANASAEVQKWAGQPGWIGVKAHPFWHRYPVAMLDDVASLCASEGKPMLIHLGRNDDEGDFRYLPERHQNLKVIYAHGGVPFYHELWEYAKKKSSVFVDLSSTFLDKRLRGLAVRVLGAERCLYGTDGPYFYLAKDGGHDHSRILQEILQLPIADADKEKILGGNFEQIALRQSVGWIKSA